MPVLTKINTNSIADDAVTGAKIPAGAVQASEIAAGGVSGADIGYLGDGSGNLSGTIANQQLHFADAFTLTGDLTVNDDLILGKLRDDGTGQTLTHTAATNRTLTGTGTLTMGSSVEGEPKAGRVTSVDGMTGTLGSAVTGGSGLDADGGNTPSWKATLSAATSALSINTWTKVSCDVEAWDTDGAYTGGTFTVPSGESGKYVLYGSVYFSKTSVNRPRLSFYVGGTRVFTHAAFDEGVDIAGYPELTIYTVLPINAGVAVEFYAWASESGVLVYGNAPLQNQPASFGGFKLRGV